MRAFQIAQPRARFHVAKSSATAERNFFRLPGSRNVHAITRSQDGSPTPRASEVDHRIQPALLQEKIGFGNVAVNPYWRPLPRRCQCRIPDLRHGGNVNLIREHADRPACLAIIDRERAAAVKVVGAGDRAVASVNSAQGPQKLGEVYCEATEIM